MQDNMKLCLHEGWALQIVSLPLENDLELAKVLFQILLKELKD
jgi:hypothetical protein